MTKETFRFDCNADKESISKVVSGHNNQIGCLWWFSYIDEAPTEGLSGTVVCALCLWCIYYDLQSCNLKCCPSLYQSFNL